LVNPVSPQRSVFFSPSLRLRGRGDQEVRGEFANSIARSNPPINDNLLSFQWRSKQRRAFDIGVVAGKFAPGASQTAEAFFDVRWFLSGEVDTQAVAAAAVGIEHVANGEGHANLNGRNV